jgi:5'-3' exonuclease
MTRKVLVDGDIIAYRAAFATQDGSEGDAQSKTDELLSYIWDKTIDIPFPSEEDFHVYLTGSNNFRVEVAKTAVYKGNRKKVEKPQYLEVIRQHILANYPCTVAEGEEADDAIAIEATRLGPDAVIASIDKDFLQVPCTHYNFVKDEWITVEEFDGLRFFYTQVLTGDAVDNIKGLYRVGPVKAGQMLEGITTEVGLYEACMDAYLTSKEGLMVDLKDRPQWAYERVLENARLLWLRRYEGQMWTPPEVTEESLG